MTRYLNGRSVRLPTRVEVLVREDPGRGEPEQLRRIHGERHNLDRRALAPGAGQLSDALAHWWVLDGDHRGRRRETVLWASTGRAADRARQLESSSCGSRRTPNWPQTQRRARPVQTCKRSALARNAP
jgi:hypothetical protein